MLVLRSPTDVGKVEVAVKIDFEHFKNYMELFMKRKAIERRWEKKILSKISNHSSVFDRLFRLFEIWRWIHCSYSEKPISVKYIYGSALQSAAENIFRKIIRKYLKTPLSGLLGTLFYEWKMRLETNKFWAYLDL